MFIYWSIFSIILSRLKELNVLIFLLSISKLILVILIPVAHEGLLQLKKPSAFYFATVIFITPGMLLIALSLYAKYKGELHNVNMHNLIADSCAIPAVYSVYFILVFSFYFHSIFDLSNPLYYKKHFVKKLVT